MQFPQTTWNKRNTHNESNKKRQYRWKNNSGHMKKQALKNLNVLRKKKEEKKVTLQQVSSTRDMIFFPHSLKFILVLLLFFLYIFFIFFYFFYKDEVDTGFTTVTEFSAHRILYSKNIYKIISIIYVKNTTREQNL